MSLPLSKRLALAFLGQRWVRGAKRFFRTQSSDSVWNVGHHIRCPICSITPICARHKALCSYLSSSTCRYRNQLQFWSRQVRRCPIRFLAFERPSVPIFHSPRSGRQMDSARTTPHILIAKHLVGKHGSFKIPHHLILLPLHRGIGKKILLLLNQAWHICANIHSFGLCITNMQTIILTMDAGIF